jgi:hypothetical protein
MLTGVIFTGGIFIGDIGGIGGIFIGGISTGVI